MNSKIIIFSFLAVFAFFAFNNIALALDNADKPEAGTPAYCPPGVACLPNPLGAANDDPRVIIGNIINAALGLVGSLALLMFIYGGVIWLTSQGNEQKIDQGKKLIVWAALGLIVIFTSYAIVKTVIQAIQGG